MRRAGWFALAVAATVITAVAQGQAHADDFQVSFQAGVRDAAGCFAGGTEMRLLTAHDGKLYAGNGYWEDRPGPEGRQGAEILVLDTRPACLGGSITPSRSGCRRGRGATSR
jgi:hypothetical protein